MRTIFIVCLLALLGVSPMAQGQDTSISHKWVPDLPRYCGRVVGPTGQGIWGARVLFEYEGKSKVRFTGLLGEFCLVIPEIPDVLVLRVEKDGFETSEWKYPAKEKGDNYLTLRMLPKKGKVLNEVTVSADKIQVKLGEKTLEYQYPYKSLRGDFERHLSFDLPDFDAGRVKGKPIHYGNIDINKEGWDEEDLEHERIALEAVKGGYGFIGLYNEDIPGYAIHVADQLIRGGIPYARVGLIDGKDTVRLTCDALGRCFWETSKVINNLKFFVLAEGYETRVHEWNTFAEPYDGQRNLFLLNMWPKHFRDLNRAIILEDKIQIIQGDTLTYPLQEGAVKPFEEDFAGNLLRGLPGVSMENGLLTINGKPIHCVGVIREDVSLWNDLRAGKLEGISKTK